jgi:hypothetical protein
VRLGGDDYVCVDMAGAIRLDNKKRQAVTIEVTRRVLGLADAVGQDGEMRQLDLAQAWNGGGQPGWRSWWSWLYWWFRHNGFAEFRWTVELQPGAGIALAADWRYFWR